MKGNVMLRLEIGRVNKFYPLCFSEQSRIIVISHKLFS